MNIENDPRLTAYALGELGDQERSIFEQDLANIGGADESVRAIRVWAERLREAYAAEPVYAMTDEQRAVLLAEVGPLPLPVMIEEEMQHSDKILPWVTQPVISEVDTQKIAEALKPSRWSQVLPVLGSLGVAAGVVWLAALVLMNQRPDPANPAVASTGPNGEDPERVVIRFNPTAPLLTGVNGRGALSGLPPYRYGVPLELKIAGAESSTPADLFDPAYVGYRRSSFPVLEGDESFEALRWYLAGGKLPPADAVRVAELLNAFDYGYPLPAEGQTFAVDTELASCPWAPDRQLLQIGVRAHEGEPSLAIAEGVSMAVEFNPATVEGYRLIGEMEASDVRGDSAAPSATVASGQSVTALYEVLPRSAGEGAPAPPVKPDEMIIVRVDYQDGVSAGQKSMEATVADSEGSVPWREASDDFRFAASVAGYGMLLGGAADKPLATYELVRELARNAVGTDPDGKRKEFLEWVEKTVELKGEKTQEVDPSEPPLADDGPMLASPPKAPKKK